MTNSDNFENEYDQGLRYIISAIRADTLRLSHTMPPEELEKLACNLAVLGANLVDAINKRPAYTGLSTAKGSTTRKVRKALGFTVP